MNDPIRRLATAKTILWEGTPNCNLTLQRPCSCGCDSRGGLAGVGYLIGSDANGNGVTVWIETEDVYQALRRVLGGTDNG